MTANETLVRRPDGERYDFLTLATAGDEVLEEILRYGTQPACDELAGWEFRGFCAPEYTSLLGWRKFKLGFFKDERTAAYAGYHVTVRQNRLGEAWIDLIRHGTSQKRRWCDVLPVRPDDVDNRYPNALLLDYTSGRNAFFSPVRGLRDYVVQVYPDNKDLLLGKGYVALHTSRAPLAFYVLERYNPSTL